LHTNKYLRLFPTQLQRKFIVWNAAVAVRSSFLFFYLAKLAATVGADASSKLRAANMNAPTSPPSCIKKPNNALHARTICQLFEVHGVATNYFNHKRSAKQPRHKDTHLSVDATVDEIAFQVRQSLNEAKQTMQTPK
jgi:hypothetical protein